MGDQPPSLVIRPNPLCFKEFDLQLKLLGITLVLSPRCNWLDLVCHQQDYFKLALTNWQFRTKEQKKAKLDQVIQHHDKILSNIVNNVV